MERKYGISYNLYPILTALRVNLPIMACSNGLASRDVWHPCQVPKSEKEGYILVNCWKRPLSLSEFPKATSTLEKCLGFEKYGFKKFISNSNPFVLNVEDDFPYDLVFFVNLGEHLAFFVYDTQKSDWKELCVNENLEILENLFECGAKTHCKCKPVKD